MLRRALVLALVAFAGLASAVVLASCGGDNEASTSATTTEATTTTGTGTTEPEGPILVHVDVSDGLPVGGIVRKTVQRGDRVSLVVVSDVADEVHVHGYDLSRDVLAGREVRIAFEATIPGRFEVELEDRGVQIAELTVDP